MITYFTLSLVNKIIENHLLEDKKNKTKIIMTNHNHKCKKTRHFLVHKTFTTLYYSV